jgi:polyisoprenoid-binding protein YceI
MYSANLPRNTTWHRILLRCFAVFFLLGGATPLFAQLRPVQLPLNRKSSSIKFGVDSPSPTLQMNGAFTSFRGKLLLDPKDVTKSKVDLSLDLRSAQLLPDQILQAVFLQTAVAHLKQPETSFVSERIEPYKGKMYLIHGIYTWQGKQKRATVPVEILQAAPHRSEVRLALSGTAKDGETPPELKQLGNFTPAGSKGWAKATFVFTSNG